MWPCSAFPARLAGCILQTSFVAFLCICILALAQRSQLVVQIDCAGADTNRVADPYAFAVTSVLLDFLYGVYIFFVELAALVQSVVNSQAMPRERPEPEFELCRACGPQTWRKVRICLRQVCVVVV